MHVDAGGWQRALEIAWSADVSAQNGPTECRCKTTRCLKLYCACFAAGQLCGANGVCACAGCYNDGQHENARLVALHRAASKKRHAYPSKNHSVTSQRKRGRLLGSKSHNTNTRQETVLHSVAMPHLHDVPRVDSERCAPLMRAHGTYAAAAKVPGGTHLPRPASKRRGRPPKARLSVHTSNMGHSGAAACSQQPAEAASTPLHVATPTPLHAATGSPGMQAPVRVWAVECGGPVAGVGVSVQHGVPGAVKRCKKAPKIMTQSASTAAAAGDTTGQAQLETPCGGTGAADARSCTSLDMGREAKETQQQPDGEKGEEEEGEQGQERCTKERQCGRRVKAAEGGKERDVEDAGGGMEAGGGVGRARRGLGGVPRRQARLDKGRGAGGGGFWDRDALGQRRWVPAKVARGLGIGTSRFLVGANARSRGNRKRKPHSKALDCQPRIANSSSTTAGVLEEASRLHGACSTLASQCTSSALAMLSADTTGAVAAVASTSAEQARMGCGASQKGGGGVGGCFGGDAGTIDTAGPAVHHRTGTASAARTATPALGAPKPPPSPPPPPPIPTQASSTHQHAKVRQKRIATLSAATHHLATLAASAHASGSRAPGLGLPPPPPPLPPALTSMLDGRAPTAVTSISTANT